MIKAEELRIGNWVLHNEKWSYRGMPIPFQWNENDWYALGECSMGLDCIDPIHISEEWLLKFGFTKDKKEGRYGYRYSIGFADYRYVVERDFNEHVSHFFGIEYTDSPFEEDEGRVHNFSYDLKFVHELQNLIFAVQRVELKLK